MIVRDFPIADYHADREYTSHSKIRDFVEKGPRFYFERHIAHTIEREETQPFCFGNACEYLVQQGGEAFSRKYAVKTLPGNTKGGKQWAAAQDAAGKTIISQADYDAMLHMVEALQTDCQKGMDLIEHAEQQVTLRGELHGVKVQARPDWVNLDEYATYSVDHKTTKNMRDLLVDLDTCGASIWKLGYHSQAALVRELLRQNGYPHVSCYLLVAEKVQPYRVECIDIEHLLDAGDAWLARFLPKLAECQQSNTWPRSSGGIVKIQKPKWMDEIPTHT
jgi:hypothetical protein